MALIDDIKTSLRVSADVYDAEVAALIDAALYDMKRAGVNPELLDMAEPETGSGTDEQAAPDPENGFVRQAVMVWCKANFGYDVPEADRFMHVYDRILNALLNSSENIAAIAEAETASEEGSGQ